MVKGVHGMLMRQFTICISDTVREDKEREMDQCINGQAKEEASTLGTRATLEIRLNQASRGQFMMLDGLVDGKVRYCTFTLESNTLGPVLRRY